ncbi:MAG: hypothetical protein H0Z40_10805 [Desulfotomaculum sp.]|nr:hypothetical protein [Desulfotomaculum sp.]
MKEKTKKKPMFAPGSENIERNATEKEIKEGNFTKVTRLSYDEVDPS